jgi:hypothetical protein
VSVINPAKWEIILGLIALGVAVICVICSTYNFSSAVGEVRSRLPLQFQNDGSLWLALDTYIWGSTISRGARRKYLIGILFQSAALISMAAVCGTLVSLLGAVFFAALGFYAALRALVQWRKYKDQL